MALVTNVKAFIFILMDDRIQVNVQMDVHMDGHKHVLIDVHMDHMGVQIDV